MNPISFSSLPYWLNWHLTRFYFQSNGPLGDTPSGTTDQAILELITTKTTTPKAAEESLLLLPNPPSHLPASEEEDLLTPMIGCNKFQYDPMLLDAYLVSILRFWRGQRDAS